MAAVLWKPRAYQEEALEFALGRYGAGLILDPGLGKTSTYLAVITVLMERKEIKRTLVCAPMRVAKTVWPFEAQKWSDFNHLRVCDLTEKTDAQRDELLSKGYEVYVINPESLYKVLNPLKLVGVQANKLENPWGFDFFIADESTRFADAQTQRFKMLKPFLKFFKYRGIATGTMVPNGLEQMFGQVYLLDDGRSLGEYITHFRQMYMHPHPYLAYTYEMNPGADERIFERVAHLLLRMRAKDKLEMPELIDNVIEVDLPTAVRKDYDKFEKEFLISVLDETVPAFNRASLGIKCRQISNGFIYSQEQSGKALPLHNAKLDALENLIQEMQGRPLLVMYEFIADGQRIQERFPGTISVTGSKDIERVVRDFNAGKISLLIGHPRSAGHGLNLQEACSDICWYGVTWDLELWIQAIARLWRQGQPSPTVRNHIIVGRNTTDEGVLAGLLKKGAAQDDVDHALQLYAQRRIG